MKRILAIALGFLLSALIIFPAISQSNQSVGHSYSIKSERTNYTIGITSPSHEPAVVVSSTPYSSVKYGALFQNKVTGVGETAKSSIIGLSTPSDRGIQPQTTTPTTPTALRAEPKFSIRGMVYNDQNSNGKMDSNEIDLANWTIDLEQPAGKLISKAITNSDGFYGFFDLTPGEYTVAEVVETGWLQTSPPNGKYVVNLTSNTTDLNFGNRIIPTPIPNGVAPSNATSTANVTLAENASLSK